MDKKINSYILKLQGKAELPSELDETQNYKVVIEGAIPKVEMHDNEDGTYNRIYTLKAIRVETIDEKGHTLRLKDSRSSSSLFRARLWKQWQNSGASSDFDTWYNNGMIKLIQNAEEISGMYFD